MKRAARWLRDIADRIDRDGAPKLTHWTWTFELGQGARFREDGRGCRVAYLGSEEYEKAHTEADNPPPRVDWKALAAGDRANAVRWPDPQAEAIGRKTPPPPAALETLQAPEIAERITVPLAGKAAADLAAVTTRTRMSQTDVVNRAISLYEFAESEMSSGAKITVRRDGADYDIALL